MVIFLIKSTISMTQFALFITFYHISIVFKAIFKNLCANSQSDIIYSPISGTSQDVPDVPSPTPLVMGVGEQYGQGRPKWISIRQKSLSNT